MFANSNCQHADNKTQKQPTFRNQTSKIESMNPLKRNEDGTLYYELTERFTILGHEFNTEKTQSILYIPYQIAQVFTSEGTI